MTIFHCEEEMIECGGLLKSVGARPVLSGSLRDNGRRRSDLRSERGLRRERAMMRVNRRSVIAVRFDVGCRSKRCGKERDGRRVSQSCSRLPVAQGGENMLVPYHMVMRRRRVMVDDKFQYMWRICAGGSGDVVEDPFHRANVRIARLEVALTLRKLYRNLLRAQTLLKLPSPIYNPDDSIAAVAVESRDATTVDMTEAAAAAQKQVDEAVEFVAEIELTAEELRVGFKWS